MVEEVPKRGRGRPAVGKPVLVRLTDEQRAAAIDAGAGVESAGIRVLIDAGIAALARRSRQEARNQAAGTSTSDLC